MQVTAIRTDVVRPRECELHELVTKHLHAFTEGSLLAVTSKVVSLCEGNVIPVGDADKDDIVEREAELYLPKAQNKYGVYLTIKRNMLVPSAGVDESNSDGHYVLWPRDPQASANRCWEFLRSHFGVRRAGVVITDSTSTPLRWGVMGRCVAYCGFTPIESRIGQRDIFGRALSMTKINVADALAAAAVLCMGEADEQTPLALIGDVPFVVFSDGLPTPDELRGMAIDLDDDLYGQLLNNVSWNSRKEKMGQ